MWTQVAGNQIQGIVGSPPATGTIEIDGESRTVSGYHLLDRKILREAGWYPVVDYEAEYDPVTQYLGEPKVTIQATQVRRDFPAVWRPARLEGPTTDVAVGAVAEVVYVNGDPAGPASVVFTVDGQVIDPVAVDAGRAVLAITAPSERVTVVTVDAVPDAEVRFRFREA